MKAILSAFMMSLYVVPTSSCSLPTGNSIFLKYLVGYNFIVAEGINPCSSSIAFRAFSVLKV